MEYNVRPNLATGGWSCDFMHGGQKYLADISDSCVGEGMECMIFKYDSPEGDSDIDWSGVYCKRGVECNPVSLVHCIKEFKGEL